MVILFCAVRAILGVYIILHGFGLLNSMGCRTRWIERGACVIVTTVAFIDIVSILEAAACGQLASVVDVTKTLLLIGVALFISRMSPQTCSWENHNVDRRKKQTG